MTTTKATAKPGQGYGGPPLKYQDAASLQNAIDAYFMSCDEGEEITQYDRKRQTIHTYQRPIPYTVTDLALHLGFSERRSLIQYAGKEEYVHTIQRAKAKIEAQRVTRALTGDYEPRFAMFDLVNNFGYLNNKSEVDVNQTTHHTIEVIDAQIRQLLQDNPDLIEMVKSGDSDTYEEEEP